MKNKLVIVNWGDVKHPRRVMVLARSITKKNPEGQIKPLKLYPEILPAPQRYILKLQEFYRRHRPELIKPE